jgi:hypothetical protein
MCGTLSGRAVPSHSRQRPLAQLSMRFLLLESFSVCTADCACPCRRALVLRLLSTLHCPWPLDQLAAADTSLKHPSLLPYILVAPASRRRSFTFRLASSLLTYLRTHHAPIWQARTTKVRSSRLDLSASPPRTNPQRRSTAKLRANKETAA